MRNLVTQILIWALYKSRYFIRFGPIWSVPKDVGPRADFNTGFGATDPAQKLKRAFALEKKKKCGIVIMFVYSGHVFHYPYSERISVALLTGGRTKDFSFSFPKADFGGISRVIEK